jgi:hypothetical protein
MSIRSMLLEPAPGGFSVRLLFVAALIYSTAAPC